MGLEDLVSKKSPKYSNNSLHSNESNHRNHSNHINNSKNISSSTNCTSIDNSPGKPHHCRGHSVRNPM